MFSKKAGPDYNIEFTTSSGYFKQLKNYYSFYNVKVSGKSGNAGVKTAEEFLETLDKLIKEENYLPEKICNMDETSYSRNKCLKRISSIRRPSKHLVSRL